MADCVVHQLDLGSILYRNETALSSLMEFLRATQRVFRAPGDVPQVYLEVDGRFVGPFEQGKIGEALIHNGFIEIVSGGTLVPLNKKPFWNALSWVSSSVAVNSRHFAPLPLLQAFVKTPAFEILDNRLHQLSPGYSARNGWYVKGEPWPLAQSDVYPHLRTLFSGMQFTSPIYHGNLVGWTVAAIARTALREFPLLMLDGTEKSVGKTTVAQAISILLTGRETPTVSWSNNESEMEKRFGDFAMLPGPIVCVFDNVRAKRNQTAELRSQTLSSAATTGVASGRVMYKGMRPINFLIPIFTMNGAVVEHDLHDKTLQVRLTRPNTSGFFYFTPSPLAYAHEHRTALLSEAVRLLSEIDFSQPFTPVGRMGTFERIATHVARRLDLPYSFSPVHEGLFMQRTFDDVLDASRPAMPRVMDALLQELYSLLESFAPDAPRLDDVADRVLVHQEEYPELSARFTHAKAVVPGQRRAVLYQTVKHYQARIPQCGLRLSKDLKGNWTVSLSQTPEVSESGHVVSKGDEVE